MRSSPSSITDRGVCVQWLQRVWQRTLVRSTPTVLEQPSSPDPVVVSSGAIVAGEDPEAELVRTFLALGRAALLLRPAVADSIARPHREAIQRRLLDEMVWIDEGEVALAPWCCDAEEAGHPPARVELCDPFFLDRFPVTNEQFLQFVRHGGYEQEAVWDRAILPRVREFVDRSGAPGPRGWDRGEFPAGTAHHPVVGVNWYEADAFARWSGKRLPTDAEWVKAAACPTTMGNGPTLLQRRFPWGDVWDPGRGNVWISGKQDVVPVEALPEGASAEGARQLIGNVWEWTDGDLTTLQSDGEWRLEAPLKSLRGGSFDTYFENQVTCQLQSGDSPLARRHNVGFRCAVTGGDVAWGEVAA